MIVTEIDMPRAGVLRIPSSWSKWYFDVWEFKRDARRQIWRRIFGRGEWRRFDGEIAEWSLTA